MYLLKFSPPTERRAIPQIQTSVRVLVPQKNGKFWTWNSHMGGLSIAMRKFNYPSFILSIMRFKIPHQEEEMEVQPFLLHKRERLGAKLRLALHLMTLAIACTSLCAGICQPCPTCSSASMGLDSSVYTNPYLNLSTPMSSFFETISSFPKKSSPSTSRASSLHLHQSLEHRRSLEESLASPLVLHCSNHCSHHQPPLATATTTSSHC